MTAYYNEIDPYAAQWLRNLIRAGLIAPGDVDERSIEDVKPEEVRKYTQCHFFAGIGVWSHALRMDSLGSTLYAMTWKARVTPLGRWISALRARALPTSDNGCISWATPSARDWKDTPGMSTAATNPDGSTRTRLDQLPRQAGLVLRTPSGPLPSGATAGTAKGAALNPGLPRWLMGLPPEWDGCAPTAMPSSRRSRNSSSAPTPKPVTLEDLF